MHSQILYKDNARDSLMEGIETIAKIISNTIGPSGCYILLHKNSSALQLINKSFKIGEEIKLQNYAANTGVKLIQQAASKTNDTVGDGTTTSTIIAYNIIQQGVSHILIGRDIIKLKRGIEKGVQFVSNKVTEYSQPINDILTVFQIAQTSAGNDYQIGHVIANIIHQVGIEGIITLEESHATDIKFEITEGMRFEQGFISPSFIEKGKKMEIIQENPYILLVEQKITLTQEEIIPILELVASTNRPLLIIAEDLSKEVLSTLIINNLKQIINVVAIKAPGFGERRRLFLEDISVLTQSNIINEKMGLTLDAVQLNDLGEATKVIITKNSTIIITNKNHKHVHERCKLIRKQMNASNTIYEKETLRNRLTKLLGKAAIIKIGAFTDIELQEKKLRLKNAISATKAAIEEGIIPGGGTISIQLTQELILWAKENLHEDELIGALIVKNALLAPLQQIIQNAGYSKAIILEQIKSSNFDTGYNIVSGKFVNMYQEGIIDSAKVLRLGLQNAASIAGMILTTDCVIVNKLI